MNQIIEHPSGVFLHVQYVPRTVVSKPVIQDVRLADTNYEPIGPNLMHFLHGTYTVTDGLATPILEAISLEVEDHEAK
jgi:hypothetical protein